MIHQEFREWVAQVLRLDLTTAGPAELATLDGRTVLAEMHSVRQLLSLGEYRPLVG